MELMAHQRPPENVDWKVWVIVGGAGTGKTLALSNYLETHLNREGKRARVGLFVPTLAHLKGVLTGVSGLYMREGNRAVHEAGGEIVGFSERTVAWAKGCHLSLLAVDGLNQLPEKAFRAARAELRYKRQVAGMRGTETGGETVIATEPLTEAQIKEAGRDWIKQIAEESWSVVTRPDLAEFRMRGLLLETCSKCGEATPRLIEHDISQHDGMLRVIEDHARLCEDGNCQCQMRSYNPVYCRMIG